LADTILKFPHELNNLTLGISRGQERIICLIVGRESCHIRKVNEVKLKIFVKAAVGDYLAK
jgi:hypothetical protein